MSPELQKQNTEEEKAQALLNVITQEIVNLIEINDGQHFNYDGRKNISDVLSGLRGLEVVIVSAFEFPNPEFKEDINFKLISRPDAAPYWKHLDQVMQDVSPKIEKIEHHNKHLKPALQKYVKEVLDILNAQETTE